MLNRLDVVSTQRFLIKEYNKDIKGDTIKDIIYMFIPRLLWQSKPVIENHGMKLHNSFYNYFNEIHKQKSLLAPSFNAEAYWNYGILGVVIISVIYGIILGFLNNIHNNINSFTKYFSYLFILIPSIKWIMFFEGWIILSFIGEITIIAFVYIISSICLRALPEPIFNKRLAKE